MNDWYDPEDNLQEYSCDEDYPRDTQGYVHNANGYYWSPTEMWGANPTTNVFFDAKQYKEWMDKNQHETIKKYFAEVYGIIDKLQENIEDMRDLYGNEPFVDRAIRSLKAKAYDHLEELLVNFI